MARRRSSAGKEARLAARASAGLVESASAASAAAIGAQAVIAQRTALLAAAACGLRPADHPEISRMGTEKVEAAIAAGPAMLSWWAGMQMQLVQIWFQEVQAGARLLGWTSAPGPQAMAKLLDSAAARSRAAALGMVVANTAALTPVLDPYYGRIKRNAKRLANGGAASASLPNTGTQRRRAPRTRS